MTGNHFLNRSWPSFFAVLFAIVVSSPAFSLGLGEVQLNSALNEPLDAEIELLNTGDLGEEELLVGLASGEDFERAGVEKDFLLTGLVFRVVLTSGNAVIKVTSKQPIREPYLDFLVELQWPSGRMLREYTLLLDLPVFAPEEPKPQQVETAQSSTEQSASSQTPPAQPVRSSRPSPAAVDPDLAAGDEEYRVQAGDTAWGIANKVRPEGYNTSQTMTAIHQLNPQAFINNDINLLKKGHVLRLPQGSDVAALADQPESEVSGLIEETLNEESTPETLDATPLDDGEIVEREQTAPGRLELAAVGDEVSEESAGLGVDQDLEAAAAGTGSGDKIAAVEEELVKTQRENEDLKTRLSSLEEQIATMRRMVEINDESMRNLQQGLGQQDLKQDSASQPAATPQQASSRNWLNYLLYGAVVLIGLVLALVLLFKNKKREEVTPALATESPLFEAEPTRLDASLEERLEPVYSDESEDQPAETPVNEDLSGLELEDDEEVDPEGEADIHISLGSYGQAETLLKGAIDKSPNNAALHLKLLEVFVATGDLQQFDMQRALLSELNDPVADAKASEMRAEFDGAESEAEPVAEIIPALGEEPAAEQSDATQTTAENSDSEFNLDLDLDEIDLDELSSDIDELTFDEPEEELSGSEFNLEIPGTNDIAEQPSEVEDAFVEDTVRDIPSIDAEEECDTKLDLADAYMEMGDEEGAKDILDEVIQEGTDEQKEKARSMMEKISS